ncbi:TonB-dependent receptor plug domain-containing protein [Roseicella aquatilis]|uniref:TonB-dependent receptor n=1 Tax=Roseicella aquatilis TaxID=2527868 RepID=A0A4R4DWZ2_9PROT|nr:TonB-dependent receptor [Roseicella aquatilis]TCZ65370.1 TonB-dependent receptor [Roseicella aquatilis]
MRRISLALAALAAPALAATPGLAQTAIPEITVTGSRIPTAEERIPAAITVITRQDIEERGYQSLSEALNAVPGLRLAPQGGLGQVTSGFLRGTGSSNVLVLLDGAPVNDVASPGGAFDFGQDLLFDVERIEVARGPFSSLYGSSAIGGVVNLITRRAAPDKAFQPYGELAGGSQNTLRGGLGATGTVGAFDYLLSGNSISTRGFNALAPRFEANIPERDGFRGAATTARLGWTPVEGTRIEGLIRWRENHFGLDSVPQDDPNYSGMDRRWNGQLRGESRLLDGLWTTGLRVFSTEQTRRYTNLPDQFDAFTREDSRYRGTRTGLDWGNTLRLPSAGPLTQGALGFGVTHWAEQARTTQSFPSDFGDFTSGVRAQQHTTAGWASLQYRLLERIDLTAGLRHDSVTGVTGETTWKLGAVLQLPEVRSRLRVSAGTAFRAPSLFERFGIGSFDGFVTSAGNPDLKPERSLGWEIGSDTDLALFGRPRLVTAGWTFFQSRVRDQIVNLAGPDGIYTYGNINRADIHGAELALTLRPAPWFETTTAWTITEAFDAGTERRLPRRPEHIVSVTARLAPFPKLVIAPTVLFTGRSPEAAFASYANDGTAYAYGRSNPAGTVVNLAATWQAWDQVALFLEARNLGNSRWEPVNGFVTPGRSVLVGTRFAL